MNQTTATKTVTLRSKPSHYRNGNLAAQRCATERKAWLVRTYQPLTVVPRVGRPVTLAAGWLVCLPVDAGRLVDAGLATMAGWAYNARGELVAVTIPGRD